MFWAFDRPPTLLPNVSAFGTDWQFDWGGILVLHNLGGMCRERASGPNPLARSTNTLRYTCSKYKKPQKNIVNGENHPTRSARDQNTRKSHGIIFMCFFWYVTSLCTVFEFLFHAKFNHLVVPLRSNRTVRHIVLFCSDRSLTCLGTHG